MMTQRDLLISLAIIGLDHHQDQGQRLQISTESLKSQYRKKMLENHPDRAAILGRSSEDLTEQAIMITRSYEQLLEHVTRSTTSGPRAVPRTTRRAENFAQFLHDLGIINLSIKIEALAWLQARTPYYTSVAKEFGILTIDDINIIFSQHAPKEQFEDTALRLHAVRPDEDARIREEIRQRTPLLHEYFIEKGILTREHTEHLLEEFMLTRAA